jgi:D-alanyl-D-alanine carboxypeptidase/D-alanyl-D-alanine-endopeptidase (penicillin-binding protein 4)
MTERSPLPVYGNCIKWIQEKTIEQKDGKSDTGLLVFTDPEINWNVRFADNKSPAFDVYRPRTENSYTITEGREMKRELEVPFVTNGVQASLELLKDTLHKEITAVSFETTRLPQQKLLSQPADSLFKPLMHRSDNFFAEQVLMMVSNELLGYMDEQKLIDTLLKTDLKNFPQQPKWVDGSGLSRYNLFTPEDFVWLLSKMKDEFGMERLKQILPTGNEGTLRNYYNNESNFLFAKTGTLSGHVAFSGFLYTKKNKLLIFSFLVNNHYTSATAVRRAIEQFLRQIRNNY